MAKYIKDFMEKDYVNFATYRVIQRLPNLIDSLGQTQRKVLHVLSKQPESKKIKTASTYTLVYNDTAYLHGDVSVFNVVETMARESSNNLNLLTQEGSFGYRTNRSAAAPRYTSTRFSKAARMIFKKEDQPIQIKQEFEGQEIEPKFMLPILPISAINGYNAIAVGFASKFLSRHPNDVIDELIRILKSKSAGKSPRPKNLKPAFAFFKGNVIHDTSHNDPSAWFLTGVVKKMKRKGWVKITEVPPEYTRESYIKKLKKMLDKGIIKDYNESSSKNNFDIEVKVTPELWSLTEDQLIDKLGLVDKFIENFTFLFTDTVTKFNTIGEYLIAFVEERQKYYEIRKKYVLEQLKKEISILEEKIQFINAVNNGKIIITKRKKVDLEKELQSMGYTKFDGNFDHLLGMRMYALTAENVKKFNDSILAKKKEFNDLLKTSIEQLHIQELKELYKFIQPELQKKGLA